MAEEIDKQLFDAENTTLQSAKAIIQEKCFAENPLLAEYVRLTESYEQLLRITKKVFRISDSQGSSLHRRQNELKNLLDNANQGFLTFGSDFAVNRQYSAECIAIFGKRIGGLSILNLLSGEPAVVSKYYELFTSVFQASHSSEQLDFLGQLPGIVSIDDKDIRVEYKMLSQWDDATEQRIIMMVLTDVTEKRRAEAQIHYLSYHDKLTSLYNRAYVDSVLHEMDSADNLPLGVIVIDMNGLKLTNDVFGHEQGDRLLVRLAQVLKSTCRSNDVIARWGGDEFIVLLPSSSSTVCDQVCDRIREALKAEEPDPIPLRAAMGSAVKVGGKSGIGEVFSTAESRMYSEKLLSARSVRQTILSSMGQTLTKRCHENVGHIQRVHTLALSFALHLGLKPDSVECKQLDLLAPLHDIGKVSLQQEVLGKPGPLNPDEWEIIKSHSETGARMAQAIGEAGLADIIIALHERWDGTGYPYGLSGSKIPYMARLFSIVDVFDVVTHDRPYRQAATSDQALAIIQDGAGSQFDPNLACQFVDYVRKNIL